MTDIPELFNAPMVRALLDGRKTMTRRALKPQPQCVTGLGKRIYADADWRKSWRANGDDDLRYAVGDRIWVRETWKPHSVFAELKPRDIPVSRIFYSADPGYAPSNTPWHPSIHMPRWASRLTLTVIEVTVERLQDIPRQDALDEGLSWMAPTYGVPGMASTWAGDPRDAFAALWDALYGPGAWDGNPWVQAPRFTVAHHNIDAEVPA